MGSGAGGGFSPATIVERSILDAVQRGERLITLTRLVAAVVLVAAWPLTAWLQPAVATRQRALATVAIASACLSALSLAWLRRHRPRPTFLALSVAHDAAFVTALLLVGMLWRGPWYVGTARAPGMAALLVVMVMAGLRLSRRLALLGIALGWGASIGLLALEAVLYPGRYPISVDVLLGVAVNLFAGSFTARAFTTRTRRLIDDAARLAVAAARAARRLGAYIPVSVARETLARSDQLRGAERAEVVVMFTRVATATSTQGDPATLIAERNAYFEVVADAVSAAGGIIDKFRHDGVMAVFGATPESEDAPAGRALQSAAMIERGVGALNRARRGKGLTTLEHRAGLHHGPVALGHVGTSDRIAYTAIGDVVNVAARLAASASEEGERALVTQALVARARQEKSAWRAWAVQPLGRRQLRGRREATEVVALRPPEGTPSAPSSQPTSEDWDVQPSSGLVAGAWREAVDASSAAVPAVSDALDRAVRDAERGVAAVRAAIGLVAILFSPLLTGSGALAPQLGYLALGGAGVATSWLTLRRLRDPTPVRRAFRWPVLVDVVLAASATLMVATVDRGHRAGVAYVITWGLLYVVVLLSGLRLNRSMVLQAGGLAALSALGLFAFDALSGTPPLLHNLVTISVILGGSVLLAVAAVTRASRLVDAVAAQARDAARARERLGAYASRAIADEALESDDLELGGRRLDQIAVLACDLRGFTRTAEGLAPEALVDQLNAYFDAMAVPIREQGGVIDSFVGDAILVVFGAPRPLAQPALRALRTAVGMCRALHDHNRDRAARGLSPLRHGIGVAMGPAVAGHIGSETRACYTVIGSAMTDAEALEAATKRVGAAIVASEDAIAAAREEAAPAQTVPDWERLEAVTLDDGRVIAAARIVTDDLAVP